MTTIRFDSTDLSDDLPAPGWYRAQITSARFRKSASGNAMVQVVFALVGVPATSARLAEYFVLEGASHHGLAMARRRLALLYRAAGHAPEPGDEVVLSVLVGNELEIEIERDSWQGHARLRVVAHRPRQSARGDDEPPF